MGVSARIRFAAFGRDVRQVPGPARDAGRAAYRAPPRRRYCRSLARTTSRGGERWLVLVVDTVPAVAREPFSRFPQSFECSLRPVQS
jgi:hypothetical protein